jgi:hypothetical protein
VEHEPLVGFALDHLDLLLIVGRAQRDGDQRLGLAAREDRRPVRAGQRADVPPDLADLVESPAVEPPAVSSLKMAFASTFRSTSPSGSDAINSSRSWSTRS